MITVYHLRNSRSERILWLLEELGLDSTIEVFDRDASSRAPAALREEIGRYVRFVDANLAGCEFAAGEEFSAADVMLAYALLAKARGHLETTQHLLPYLERMIARPAYRRAMQQAA